MEQSFDFSSYNSIKRLSEDELETLWNKYLSDKTDKQSRDKLIVQYIYLVRYAVGRVKVTLPSTVSIEDIAGYGVEGLINAIELVEDVVYFDVFVKIKFGYSVRDVAFRVQENIKSSIESMTDFKVGEVNIHCAEVVFDNAEEEE